MDGNRLQRFFAYGALFLLPFPSLNFGVSLTCGDVFLVLAMLLNAGEVTRIHPFQIPLLLAFPFFLLSTVLDPTGDLIAVLQVIYLWGVVVPFGWCAFTNIPVPRIAQVLLLSCLVNSLAAVGQVAGIVPPVGNQRIVEFGQDFRRAAGISLACNSLVMTLTPMFLLLPYVRHAALRISALLGLVAGLAATVSKSIALAAPALCFYLFRERKKGRVALGLIALLAVGGSIVESQSGLGEFWAKLSESAEHRLDHADNSFDNRLNLIRVASDLFAESFVIGFGTTGAWNQMSMKASNTVHVYYLGLVLTAGLVGATLLLSGHALLIAGLWRIGQVEFSAFLVAYMLGLLVTTVLVLSFQSLPFLIGGAVFVRAVRYNFAAQCRAVVSHRLSVARSPLVMRESRSAIGCQSATDI
jgi:hypothetical protein